MGKLFAIVGLVVLVSAPVRADEYLDVYANERITEHAQSMPYFPQAGAYEAHGTGAPLQYVPENQVTVCQTTSIGTACSR